MPLPNPTRSQAVLIGCAAYDHLEALPAVANNLTGLAERFRDPRLWGLPKNHCRVLTNPGSPSDVLDVIEEAAGEATDTLVVYFAGHGLRDPRNSDLYLGLSEVSPMRLRRGIRYDDMRSIIVGATHCASKVVILDCCYSGAAMLGGMGSANSVADQARIEGTFLFTAAAETKLALAPVGERHTSFTGEILRALDKGVADGGPLLDLETLYRHVRRSLEAKRMPIPQYRAVNSGTMIALGRNLLWLSQSTRLPKPSASSGSLEERVAKLRTDGAHRTADNALLSAGGLLDLAELFEIIENLRLRGRHADIVKLLEGTTERTRVDLVDLVCWLDLHQFGPHGDTLIAEVVKGPAGEVTKTAVLLSERGAQHRLGVLLDQVARAPERLVELLEELPEALSGAVSDMLHRQASVLPYDQLPPFADALRAAGRPEYAADLIAHATDRAAALPLKELAELVIATSSRRRTRGNKRQAPERELLLSAAYRATPDPRGRMALLAELSSAMTPSLARQAIEDAAQTFSESQLTELLDALDDAAEDDRVEDLCTAIRTHRGVDGLATIAAKVPPRTAPPQVRTLQEAIRAVWPAANDAAILRDVLRRTYELQRPVAVKAFLRLRKGNPQEALSLLARESPATLTVENILNLAQVMRRVGEMNGLRDLLTAAATRLSGPEIVALGHRLDVQERAILASACLDISDRSEERDRAMIDLFRALRPVPGGVPELIKALGDPKRLEDFFSKYGPIEYADEIRELRLHA